MGALLAVFLANDPIGKPWGPKETAFISNRASRIAEAIADQNNRLAQSMASNVLIAHSSRRNDSERYDRPMRSQDASSSSTLL